jgi:hypothetical protein
MEEDELWLILDWPEDVPQSCACQMPSGCEPGDNREPVTWAWSFP